VFGLVALKISMKIACLNLENNNNLLLWIIFEEVNFRIKNAYILNLKNIKVKNSTFILY